MYKKQVPKKFLSIILVIFISITSLCGCADDPKNFTYGNFTITLTKGFSEESSSDFDIYLESDDVIFNAKEETFSDLEASGFEFNSIDDYCSVIMTSNGVGSQVKAKHRNDYVYFVNSRTANGASYKYFTCIFETGSSFWLCSFGCKSVSYDRVKDDILEWADSIVIKE